MFKFGKMAPTDDEKRKNQDGPSPDRPKKRVSRVFIHLNFGVNKYLNQLLIREGHVIISIKIHFCWYKKKFTLVKNLT